MRPNPVQTEPGAECAASDPSVDEPIPACPVIAESAAGEPEPVDATGTAATGPSTRPPAGPAGVHPSRGRDPGRVEAPCSALTITPASYPAGGPSTPRRPGGWSGANTLPSGASPSSTMTATSSTAGSPAAAPPPPPPAEDTGPPAPPESAESSGAAAALWRSTSGPGCSPSWPAAPTCRRPGRQWWPTSLGSSPTATAHLAALDADPAARLPNAGLRRHVQMRDRTCVAPGCRRPAHKSDVDHTRDHARGGPTVQANVGPLCLQHHMMKHHDGWTLTQPEPGHFHWRSPLGQQYRTRGEPIAPDLPEPLPGPEHDRPDRLPRDRRPSGRPRTDLPPLGVAEATPTRTSTRTPGRRAR